MCHDTCKCFGWVGGKIVRVGDWGEVGREDGGAAIAIAPRRERRQQGRQGVHYHDFNPRSREGSDSNIIQQISFSLYNTVYFVSNNIK